MPEQDSSLSNQPDNIKRMIVDFLDLGFTVTPDGVKFPPGYRGTSQEPYNDMHFRTLIDKSPQDRQFLNHLRAVLNNDVGILSCHDDVKILAAFCRDMPEDSQLGTIKEIRDYLEENKQTNTLETYTIKIFFERIIVDELPKYLDTVKGHTFFEEDFIAAEELAQTSKFMEPHRLEQVIKNIAQRMNDNHESFSHSLVYLENRSIEILNRAINKDEHILYTEPDAVRDFSQRFIGLTEDELEYIAGIAAAFIKNKESSVAGYLRALDKSMFVTSVEEKVPTMLLPLYKENLEYVKSIAGTQVYFKKGSSHHATGYSIVDEMVDKLNIEEQKAVGFYLFAPEKKP